MLSIRTTLACILLALASTTTLSYAQSTNLLPKYGGGPRDEAQLASDEEFIKTIAGLYSGNRAKAAEDFAITGWNYLRKGESQDAMRRFNQAWLLDKSNGSALWGMAAIVGGALNTVEALKLFAEAERTLGGDIHFSADYAMTLGVAGADSHNDALLKDAFVRFEQNYQRAPQNVGNLQNWAMTLLYAGRYSEAWEKIQLAEVAPHRASEIHASFIAALQAKMPRPTQPERSLTRAADRLPEATLHVVRPFSADLLMADAHVEIGGAYRVKLPYKSCTTVTVAPGAHTIVLSWQPAGPMASASIAELPPYRFKVDLKSAEHTYLSLRVRALAGIDWWFEEVTRKDHENELEHCRPQVASRINAN